MPLNAQGDYAGDFFALLSPFALAVGLLSAAMFVVQGSAWLVLRTDGVVRERASRTGLLGWAAFAVMWILVTVWSRSEAPALWDAYGNAMAWLAPLLTFAAMLGVPWALRARARALAFGLSSASIVGLLATLGIGLWPSMLPARELGQPLTVAATASSDLTLTVMLIVAIVGMPLVLIYAAWTYWTFRRLVTTEELDY